MLPLQHLPSNPAATFTASITTQKSICLTSATLAKQTKSLKCAKWIAKMLAEANVKSVYELDTSKIWCNKYKAEYLENLMLFPADCIKALKNLGTNGHNYYLSDKDIFNMACCLEYQSCDVENWMHTDAYWIIKAIKDMQQKVWLVMLKLNGNGKLLKACNII